MPTTAAETHVKLPADTNQALGIAQYAIDFLSDDPAKRGEPDASVLEKTNQFFTDAVLCGLSALALKTNAPTILRDEALQYPVTDATHRLGKATQRGATVFGSSVQVQPEKAILANNSAVREWDSNGTNFGYNPALGHTAGEFGHNDFYGVCIAGAQMTGRDGAYALKAMVCHDEIRGRLAEVFSLKTYKVDHVVHGAIASAAVFGAMLGAKPEQIESAIGMVVAHFIPFRAIRAGKQLSDSKGASAAISSEVAITAVRRSMSGFLGPRDIFRNPESIFRIFEGPGQMFQKVGATSANTENKDASPFDLVLGRAGDDFAIMGMHFKLGLYEHQSAGALQALIDLLNKAPHLLDDETGSKIKSIKITAYEPAFGIIGDPAKRNPTTRQSADHSMVYIVGTLLRKALSARKAGWKELMLEPYDYSADAIANERTRSLMDKIEFYHGGEEYDKRYPDGIPTSLIIEDTDGTEFDSGMVMYPAGHARNTVADLNDILAFKFNLLGKLAFESPEPIVERFQNLSDKSAEDIANLHDFEIQTRDGFE
ncbi:MAG: MmgE/PrpD family protein [Phycisphaerales bacterium]|nr:MmgE/PrpD family protein [Phycisphaerales bacterium]